MWIRKSLASYNFRNLYNLVVRSRFPVEKPSSDHLPEALTSKYRFGGHLNQGLHFLSSDTKVHNHNTTNMEQHIGNKTQQPVTPRPLHRNPVYSSWGKWIWAAIVSIILTFSKTNWGQFLKLQGEVEMAVDIVENAAEVVERLGTATEKLAMEVAEKFPDNEKITKTALVVERVAEEAIKDARLTEDIIHKIDELKQEVETLTKTLTKGVTEVSNRKSHDKK